MGTIRLLLMMPLAVAALVALPGRTAQVGAASRPLAMGMGMGAVTIGPITAGAYRLTLEIGPRRPMYTQAQYARLHPTTGELMLGGTMTMGSGAMVMGMGAVNRHLELRIQDGRTLRVVTTALVSVTYQPVVGMGMMAIRPQVVPVATMIDIGGGMASFHYGNNVALAAQTTYRITARVNNRATAVFTVRFAR